MKVYLISICLLVINFTCGSAEHPKSALISTNTKLNLLKTGLEKIWTWITNKGQNKDTFVGRCFGVAKRIKAMLPIIIFKLGMIVATLGFLTLFSMKTIGLLVLLLVINVSGLAAKLALFFKGSTHGGTHEGRPQNVHFHVHQNKNGQYNIEPSSYYGHDYFDRSDEYYGRSSTENLLDQLHNLDAQYDRYK